MMKNLKNNNILREVFYFLLILWVTINHGIAQVCIFPNKTSLKNSGNIGTIIQGNKNNIYLQIPKSDNLYLPLSEFEEQQKKIEKILVKEKILNEREIEISQKQVKLEREKQSLFLNIQQIDDFKTRILEKELVLKHYQLLLDKNPSSDAKEAFLFLKSILNSTNCLLENYKDDVLTIKDSLGNKSFAFPLRTLREDPNFIFIDEFRGKFTRAKKFNKYGFIDAKGKIIINFKYDYAENFNGRYAFAKNLGKWYYIDSTGKEILSNTQNFKDIKPVKYEKSIARLANGNFCLINFKGEKISEEFLDMSILNDNILVTANELGDEGYINMNGKTILHIGQFEIVKIINDNILLAKNIETKKKGVINSNGEIILPFEFSNVKIDSLFEYFWVERKENSPYNQGIYKFNGEEVIKPIFEIEPFFYTRDEFIKHLSFLELSDENLFHYYFRESKRNSPEYDKLYNDFFGFDLYNLIRRPGGSVKYVYDYILKNPLTIFKIKSAHTQGIIYRNGKVILEPKYHAVDLERDRITLSNSKIINPKYMIVSKDYSESAIFSIDGKQRTKFQYNSFAEIPKQDLFITDKFVYPKNIMAIDLKTDYHFKGVINSIDREIIPFKYKHLSWINELELLLYCKEMENGSCNLNNCTYGLVDLVGNEVFEIKAKSIQVLTRIDSSSFKIAVNERVNILNLQTYKLVFQNGVDDIIKKDIYGNFIIKNNNKFGVNDSVGIQLIPCKYSQIEAIANNLYKIGSPIKTNINLAVFSNIGKQISEFKYKIVQKFEKNVGIVSEDGFNFGILNSDGAEIVPLNFSKINYFKDCLELEREGETFKINFQGECISENSLRYKEIVKSYYLMKN